MNVIIYILGIITGIILVHGKKASHKPATSLQLDLMSSKLSGLIQYHFPALHRKYCHQIFGRLFANKIALEFYGNDDLTELSEQNVLASLTETLSKELSKEDKLKLEQCIIKTVEQ